MTRPMSTALLAQASSVLYILHSRFPLASCLSFCALWHKASFKENTSLERSKFKVHIHTQHNRCRYHRDDLRMREERWELVREMAGKYMH